MKKTVIVLSILFGLSLGRTEAVEPGGAFSRWLAMGWPENAGLRSRLFAEIIGAPMEAALAFGEKLRQGETGPVLVRSVARDKDFLVEFLNPDSSGAFKETMRGSCIVQRSRSEGNYLLQARIYLQDDPGCYLKLYPGGSGTKGDLVMYGAVLKKGIAFPGMLYKTLTMTLSELAAQSVASFDWDSIVPGPKSNGQAGKLPSSAMASSANTGPSIDPLLARISTTLSKSSSTEALLEELRVQGETLREFDPRDIAQQWPAGLSFAGDSADMTFARPYVAFPAYNNVKGIDSSAARSLIFLDYLVAYGSSYLLVGDGARFIVAPAMDARGAIVFEVIVDGARTTWESIASTKGSGKLRIFRIGAGT